MVTLVNTGDFNAFKWFNRFKRFNPFKRFKRLNRVKPFHSELFISNLCLFNSEPQVGGLL